MPGKDRGGHSKMSRLCREVEYLGNALLIRVLGHFCDKFMGVRIRTAPAPLPSKVSKAGQAPKSRLWENLINNPETGRMLNWVEEDDNGKRKDNRQKNDRRNRKKENRARKRQRRAAQGAALPLSPRQSEVTASSDAPLPTSEQQRITASNRSSHATSEDAATASESTAKSATAYESTSDKSTTTAKTTPPPTAPKSTTAKSTTTTARTTPPSTPDPTVYNHDSFSNSEKVGIALGVVAAILLAALLPSVVVYVGYRGYKNWRMRRRRGGCNDIELAVGLNDSGRQTKLPTATTRRSRRYNSVCEEGMPLRQEQLREVGGTPSSSGRRQQEAVFVTTVAEVEKVSTNKTVASTSKPQSPAWVCRNWDEEWWRRVSDTYRGNGEMKKLTIKIYRQKRDTKEGCRTQNDFELREWEGEPIKLEWRKEIPGNSPPRTLRELFLSLYNADDLRPDAKFHMVIEDAEVWCKREDRENTIKLTVPIPVSPPALSSPPLPRVEEKKSMIEGTSQVNKGTATKSDKSRQKKSSTVTKATDTQGKSATETTTTNKTVASTSKPPAWVFAPYEENTWWPLILGEYNKSGTLELEIQIRKKGESGYEPLATYEWRKKEGADSPPRTLKELLLSLDDAGGNLHPGDRLCISLGQDSLGLHRSYEIITLYTKNELASIVRESQGETSKGEASPCSMLSSPSKPAREAAMSRW